MSSKRLLLAAFVSSVVICVGCSQILDPSDNAANPGDSELQDLMARPMFATAMPPSLLETVTFGGQSLTFWPYTGADFSGTGHDPINLIFIGHADPRDIRAALLSLDGNRPAFDMLPIPPFTSRWDDAIGDVQTGYGEASGWCGGVIQLACGDYGPLRFHLRLFKMGDWTVGSAHFEMLIPGTADHQVLSWELAELFVISDIARAGILDGTIPMIPTGQINEAPWRTIPTIIYNGLPVELRTLIEGPPGDAAADVPINTDGHAVILNLATALSRISEVRTQDFIIEYGQAVPKPFCESSPDDFVWVQGPVHLSQTSSLDDNGVYHVTFRAEGQLAVTPVNPITGDVIGETLTAEVFEHHDAHLADNLQWASSILSQHLLPDTAAGAGRLFVRLNVRTDGQNGYLASVRCVDSPWEDVPVWNLPPAMREPRIAPGAKTGLRY